MRESGAGWPVWLLGAAVVGAALAAASGGLPFVRSSRDVILDAARRVHGDILVLSVDNPPPDLEGVLELTAGTPGVVHASIVAVWEVRIESVAASSPAVLELQSLDAVRRRRQGRMPQPRSPDRPPEVTVGSLLAEKLRISAGDSVVVHVAPGAATTGAASRRCKVVSVADVGFDHFDERLVIADISHLADFALIPIGVALKMSSPDVREGFAADLQQRLSPRWRAFPLEQVIEPLLRPRVESASDAADSDEPTGKAGERPPLWL